MIKIFNLGEKAVLVGSEEYSTSWANGVVVSILGKTTWGTSDPDHYLVEVMGVGSHLTVREEDLIKVAPDGPTDWDQYQGENLEAEEDEELSEFIRGFGGKEKANA